MSRITQWLWPPRCLVCADAGVDGLELCARCRADLPWNEPCCARCALPLAGSAAACGRCLRAPPPYAGCFAALRYAAPVDRLLPRFKFHAGLAEGRLLAALLRERAPAAAFAGADLLVPLPLHRQRLGQRGYNQALELARPLAQAWQIALAPGALRRTRATAAQSELGAAERRRNVRGAFSADHDAVRDRRVLLLDDVVTTAATVNEAAAMLLAAGAADVRVLAVARAPSPRDAEPSAGGIAGAISMRDARPDPITASARNAIGAPGENRAAVPTAVHAGWCEPKNSACIFSTGRMRRRTSARSSAPWIAGKCRRGSRGCRPSAPV